MAARTSNGRKASSVVGRAVRDVINHDDEYIKQAKSVLHEVNNTSLAEVESRAVDWIRDNPGRSVMYAALAGAFVGFFWLRR